MKTFIYTTTEKRAQFGTKVICTVYRMKNNKPDYIGECSFNTQACRGADSEVFNFLKEKKEIKQYKEDYYKTNMFNLYKL